MIEVTPINGNSSFVLTIREDFAITMSRQTAKQLQEELAEALQTVEDEESDEDDIDEFED